MKSNEYVSLVSPMECWLGTYSKIGSLSKEYLLSHVEPSLVLSKLHHCSCWASHIDVEWETTRYMSHSRGSPRLANRRHTASIQLCTLLRHHTIGMYEERSLLPANQLTQSRRPCAPFNTAKQQMRVLRYNSTDGVREKETRKRGWKMCRSWKSNHSQNSYTKYTHKRYVLSLTFCFTLFWSMW